MKRHAYITQVKPEHLEEYKTLHASVWPSVLSRISASNIQNYSIFWQQMPNGEHYLFSYFEYTGNDWKTDAAKMATDEETQRWWAVCKPCLQAIGELPEGEVWAPINSIFFNP